MLADLVYNKCFPRRIYPHSVGSDIEEDRDSAKGRSVAREEKLAHVCIYSYARGRRESC